MCNSIKCNSVKPLIPTVKPVSNWIRHDYTKYQFTNFKTLIHGVYGINDTKNPIQGNPFFPDCCSIKYDDLRDIQIPGFESFPAPLPFPVPTEAENIARMRMKLNCVNWSLVTSNHHHILQDGLAGNEVRCLNCGRKDNLAFDEESNTYLFSSCYKVCYLCERITNDAQLDNNDKLICEDCLDKHYSICVECQKYVDDKNIIDMSSIGLKMCEDCYDRSEYFYCGGCGDFFHTSNMSNCEHDSLCSDCYKDECCGDCCQPNKELFLNGVKADESFEIHLNDDVLCDDALDEINDLLTSAELTNVPLKDFDLSLVNEKGNLTTRIKKFIKEKDGVKIDKIKIAVNNKEINLLSHIGNIIAKNRVDSETTFGTFTRDFNQPDYKFVNSGSCWFGESERKSLCTLKFSGGIAFRTFDCESHADNNKRPQARIWVYPIKHRGTFLELTEDEVNCDGFILINGYHRNDSIQSPTFTLSKIFADFMGLKYQNIDASIEDTYINSSYGYLVAKKEILEKTGYSMQIIGGSTCENWH